MAPHSDDVSYMFYIPTRISRILHSNQDTLLEISVGVISGALLPGTIVVRTFDRHKNLHIHLFLLTIFGPD